MNISQAAHASGLTPKMLRYYESIGLLEPALRTASGYRQYRAADLETLAFLKRARDLGFSLEEIGTLFELQHDRHRASADVKALASAHVQDLNRRIEEFISLRDTLQTLINECQGNKDSACVILDSLAGADEGKAEPG
ncbi:Cu(I)-responsive transcriptional regulator [Pseudomonas alliivorans]|uniref:Cu(I)-responsive transcriptional regulator n=1 Tax=Pseudomonas cannabina pv. alisalensis TaxID=757414 RepID=A0ABS1X7U7_PSEC1|nr:Cu(I)-responsive transcriptional regulator [Pseudomonas cannabina]MEE4964429.1 Cu(I)-responsive transcriptional regulator [Pseudomonas alliivorans]MBM0137559.1 Cu(I)-responsive transcriptional regulator [Pseudomonas cannabina pv. alisalensis]MEE4974582.1 Cu(I)-responsive transcriptional regulator [Pseudomonas alliivorans]MEE4979731.1 Cu(I)-responsive transcriptional regulator [Pseudomonas alliivorans]MEE4984886.1 Cu(I)-responsive transcriptional regulator [Pseudomonas alliivorans]